MSSKKTDAELPNPVIPFEPPPYKTKAPKKSERQLRVKVTDQELVEKGRMIGEKHAERAKVESEFDTVKAQFKERLARVEAEISEIAGHLQVGFEYRKTACETTFDDPEKGKKTTRRLDTREIIDVEAMAMEELQGELALIEDKKVGVDSTGNVTVAADGKDHDEGGEK